MRPRDDVHILAGVRWSVNLPSGRPEPVRSRQVKRLFVVAVAVLLTLAPAGTALASAGAAPALYKNCTNLNKRYPHGLGKLGARDHTSGTPVTNFKRSTKLYRLAMSYNRGLDRDKDGIACEKV